jgi:hypothetical protein
MISIIKGLLGFKSIAEQLTTAYVARTNAVTDKERIAADVEIETLKMQRDIVVAEQGSRSTSWVRPAFAFPFVVFIWKLVLWDKVLGWGVTDPLGSDLKWILVTIVGAFFITGCPEGVIE